MRARDLVDEAMSQTKKFDKRFRFTLPNRIDEKALNVLEAIVEANEINPITETDPRRRANLCMARFDLQTSALTGCKTLLIFLDITKNHGQIDNRACKPWIKRALDVKHMAVAWGKKDAVRLRQRPAESKGQALYALELAVVVLKLWQRGQRP